MTPRHPDRVIAARDSASARRFRLLLTGLLTVGLLGPGAWLAAPQVAGQVSAEGGTAAAPRPPVIAIIDTGINPYHLQFRNGATTNPLEEAGVASPIPLEISLPSSGAAPVPQDAGVWDSVEEGRLYWFPGTKVSGAISFGAYQDLDPFPLFDFDGHGTSVASVCCGLGKGVNADAILLVVQFAGTADSFVPALNWIARTSWIDLVSISYGSRFGVVCPYVNAPEVVAAATREVSESGKPILVAAGNGNSAPNLSDCISGPPWVTRVGGSYPDDRAYETADTKPAELLGYSDWVVARSDSVAGYEWGWGTSLSAPSVAGHAARLIREARLFLGNPTPDCLCLAKGPTGLVPTGPIADGELNAAELASLLMSAAKEVPWLFYTGMPSHTFTHGLVNPWAADRAVEILFGREPPPPKPEADEWYARWMEIRSNIWGS